MAIPPLHRRTPNQVPLRTGALRRAAQRLLAVAAAVVVSAGLVCAPAHAAPAPTDLEKQIDAEWAKIEPTIEQYNKLQSQLKANQKKASAIQAKIEPLALQSQLALARVGSLASRYYMTGPASDINALLANGEASKLADQLTYLDRIATREQKEIAGVVAAKNKYEAEKQKLDALIAAQTKQQAELAKRKVEINAKIKQLQAMLPRTTVKVTGCPTIRNVVGTAQQYAVKRACQQIGKPYVWNAAGPNAFDCSGLTLYAYQGTGINLPHYTGDQMTMGRQVSRSNAVPGDLVFFPHHVGLYIGNGLMVHAPQEGQPVQVENIDNLEVLQFRHL